jgi:adenine-specific DNA-methyltransferase
MMDELSELDSLSVEQLIEIIREKTGAGVNLSFPGKSVARGIARKVRPRVQRTLKLHSAGSDEGKARNLVIEGDNLQALASLYKERGQVDLILTDPPYNTGNDFRYNDKWDSNPNDPDMGDFVKSDDPARHTKWMKFMWPRLQMLKGMLKPSGVIAICIDHRELFHLGQMLDELFGDSNRLAIISWEKTAAPRSDASHVTTTTEYVLVYAKSGEIASTQRLDRKASSDTRYGNPDGDPEGTWREANLTARTHDAKNDYAIQSPFTGELHYPAGGGAWRHPKANVKKWLEDWGVAYTTRRLDDEKGTALVVKGSDGTTLPDGAREAAEAVLSDGPFPFVWFGMKGGGRPRVKTYLEKVRKGSVPTTYWSGDDEPALSLGSTSWDHEESGRSSDGLAELNALVGPGHGFDTVKPLRLMQKLIQIWCPPHGTVLDAFAGSGTTAHAVLSLNEAQGTDRRFIMIEQGRPENGDSYAKTLTADRLRRVVTGDWQNGHGVPLGSGFTFKTLTKQVDGPALLQMEREEMVDTVVASHFGAARRRGSHVYVLDNPERYRYLVARNSENEGIYLVWAGADKNADLTEQVYEDCVDEGDQAGLSRVYHVYSRLNLFVTDDVRWYQIPDRILQDFGLDVKTEAFTEE